MRGVQATLGLWLVVFVLLLEWPAGIYRPWTISIPTILQSVSNRSPTTSLPDVDLELAISVSDDGSSASSHMSDVETTTAYCMSHSPGTIQCLVLPQQVHTSQSGDVMSATSAVAEVTTNNAGEKVVLEIGSSQRPSEDPVWWSDGWSVQMVYTGFKIGMCYVGRVVWRLCVILRQMIQRQRRADDWVSVFLGLASIGAFLIFIGRTVLWFFQSTELGMRVREKLAKAPMWVILRSTAWVSSLLVLCFDHGLQSLALVLTLAAYPLYRWLLWDWREQQRFTNQLVRGAPRTYRELREARKTDIAFYISYGAASLTLTYLYQWPLLSVFYLVSVYSTVLVVLNYRCSRLRKNRGSNSSKKPSCKVILPATPVQHTGPAHRYWMALEHIVPTTVITTLLLFVLPRGGTTAKLFSLTLPLFTWCPLLLVLLLVGHVSFRYRRFSYLKTQLGVCFVILCVFATVQYHDWYAWHLVFVSLVVLAKLLDVYSQFDLEWLHWTMFFLCLSVFFWYC